MPLFITVLIIGILSGAEVDLFIPSFPELQKVFNLTPFMVQLTLSANFLSYCICSLFAGALGDRFNRRVVILICLAIFVLGSLLCVFANNFIMLVLGRFLQGVGMSGPAILAYVIIADEYPLEKQPAMLGLLNGIVTLAMAFAPVIGSYVNLYFNWRGNFVILLALGSISLLAGYLVIPNHKGDASISLSPTTYLPLLMSKKLMIFIMSIVFLGTSYWTFIGMAPILYMEGMGVDLKHFGYYQGIIALAFSIFSILSPKILTKYGFKKGLYYSVIFCALSAVLVLINTVFSVKTPALITLPMVFLAAAVVLPINILYPITLEILEKSKARTAALLNALRLLLTGGLLEVISYFYTGTFMHLGITIVILTALSLYLIWHIFHHNWVQLQEQSSV